MKHSSNINLSEPHIILKRNEVLIKHLHLFHSNINIIISNHRILEYQNGNIWPQAQMNTFSTIGGLRFGILHITEYGQKRYLHSSTCHSLTESIWTRNWTSLNFGFLSQNRGTTHISEFSKNCSTKASRSNRGTGGELWWFISRVTKLQPVDQIASCFCNKVLL